MPGRKRARRSLDDDGPALGGLAAEVLVTGALHVAHDRTLETRALDRELGRLVDEHSRLLNERERLQRELVGAASDLRELVAVVERLFEIRKWDGYGPKVRALVSRSRSRFEGWA